MTTKYYVARLKGSWPNAQTCLEDHGFTEEQAKRIVQNAAINQSSLMLTPVGEGKAVLVRVTAEGCEGWWAIIGELYDTPQAAEQLANAVEAHMVGTGREPGKWAVFEWIENKSMRKLQ